MVREYELVFTDKGPGDDFILHNKNDFLQQQETELQHFPIGFVSILHESV